MFTLKNKCIDLREREKEGEFIVPFIYALIGCRSKNEMNNQ